jgi:hypothetical protein
MNKNFKNALGAVILLSCVVFLNACSDPETGPSNVITDSEGIKIDLDWSTGGSVSTSISDTDLDLFISKNSTEVDASESGGAYEQVNLSTDINADGSYIVSVYSYNKVGKATSYTVTVDGETVSKPYTFNSTYAKDDTYHKIDVLTIVKAGSKYTVTEIN